MNLYIQAYRQPRLWWARAASHYYGAHRRSRFSNCLPYWSKVSRLTIHKRGAIAPRSSNASRKPVTGIDLALSEGVCRKLSQAKNGMPTEATKAQAFLQSNLKTRGFNKVKRSKYKVRDSLLRLVIRHKSGQITGGIIRDMAVIRRLAAACGNSYLGILTPRSPSRFPYT